MRYKNARLLKVEDEVVRKSDKAVLVIKEIECYGQHKIVKLRCLLKDDPSPIPTYRYCYNHELEDINE